MVPTLAWCVQNAEWRGLRLLSHTLPTACAWAWASAKGEAPHGYEPIGCLLVRGGLIRFDFSAQKSPLNCAAGGHTNLFVPGAPSGSAITAQRAWPWPWPWPRRRCWRRCRQPLRRARTARQLGVAHTFVNGKGGRGTDINPRPNEQRPMPTPTPCTPWVGAGCDGVACGLRQQPAQQKLAWRARLGRGLWRRRRRGKERNTRGRDQVD